MGNHQLSPQSRWWGAAPRRLRTVAVAISLVGALGAPAACGGDPGPSPTDIPSPSDFHRGPAVSTRGDDLVATETLVTKLAVPWGVTFLPDRSALVTERHKARILKIGPGRTPQGELTVRPIATVPGVYANNEGGLLGIAASPRFARDRTVYLYFTTKRDNRIAKLRLDGRSRPEAIVTGIPSAGVHNGGRLVFGPDGYLYATTGDASRAGGAQSVHDLGGKILRMTTAGRPAPGNPFPGSLVWSYGHRNPQGMAWDDRGRMYAVEIGEAVWDELNLILPGRNYGWPRAEGMSGLPNLVNPVVAWRPEIGVTNGIVFFGRTAVITCLRGQRIYLVDLAGPVNIGSGRIEGSGAGEASIRWRPGGGITGRPVDALTGKYGRLRAAIRAPDGSVWLTTSNRDDRNQPVPADDRIVRLTLRQPASPGASPR